MSAAPVSSAPPTISGRQLLGQTLTGGNGSWGNSPTSFSYQWLQCDQGGSGCQPIGGATQPTHTITSSDVQKTLRVQVTATNADGSATAMSPPTAVIVQKAVSGTTTTPRKEPPSISFLSLKRVGTRISARFSVCDDLKQKVTVTERDSMPGRAAEVRRFALTALPCRGQTESWTLATRFRHAGRLTTTLRVVDAQRATSRTVSRSIAIPTAL
jgi:hypothetical protein